MELNELQPGDYYQVSGTFRTLKIIAVGRNVVAAEDAYTGEPMAITANDLANLIRL